MEKKSVYFYRPRRIIRKIIIGKCIGKTEYMKYLKMYWQNPVLEVLQKLKNTVL